MRLSKNNKTRDALAVGAMVVAAGLVTACSLIVAEERESTCGNGVCDPGENVQTCPQDCDVIGFCGDGVIQPENLEDCDGGNLGGLDCSMLGFEPGTLICTADCHLNPFYCGRPITCNGGVLDPGELCEVNDLNGHSCGSLGFSDVGGVLECTSYCEFDVSGCSYPEKKMDGENCTGSVQCSGDTCLRDVGGLLDGYCSHVCDFKVCPGEGVCVLDGPGGPGPLCYQSCLGCNRPGFDCYPPYPGAPDICWPLEPAF